MNHSLSITRFSMSYAQVVCSVLLWLFFLICIGVVADGQNVDSSFSISVSASGKAVPSDAVTIVNREKGVITFVLQAGQFAKKGAALAVLNNEELELELNIKDNELASIQSSVDYQFKLLQRIKETYAQESISTDSVEKIESDFEQLVIKRKNAELERKQLKIAVDSLESLAPFDGFLSDRYSSVGQYLPESQPIAEFISDSYVLDVRIPFKSLAKFENLDSLSFKLHTRFGEIAIREYTLIPNLDDLLLMVRFRMSLPKKKWIAGENIDVSITAKPRQE